MTRTISEHQARVFEYARDHLGTWFTIQELATETNLPGGSAKRQADRYQERGVFELLRISPAQVYRLTEESISSDPELVRRVEEAIPIFARRRQGWLQREAARLEARSGATPAVTRSRASLPQPRPVVPTLKKAAAGDAATTAVQAVS